MKKDSVIIEMDGNMWCAHRADFINLQESTAGFGRTELEALRSLIMEEKQVGKKDN